MGSLKILSVNCQGLCDSLKRKDVFDFLKSKNCNIYCLQDTHFTIDIENNIRSVCGYDLFFFLFIKLERGINYVSK